MSDNEKSNPFLESEDYWKPYRDNIERNKHNKEIIEVDKLCYQVFEANPEGKKLMEILVERWIMQSSVDAAAHNFKDACVLYMGMQQAIKILRNSVINHKLRMEAEQKELEKNKHE